jgi:hypothetical protein
MGLMADVAELAAGVLLGIDLRESLGLGDILGMAADAEMGHIWLLRRQALGIVGVLCERTMTGFAVDADVNAFGFGVGHVRVAPIACFMARVGDGARCDFGESVPPEVAITPKALGDESAAKDEEEDQADEEDCGHAEEMGDVLQLDHERARQPQKYRTFVSISYESTRP